MKYDKFYINKCKFKCNFEPWTGSLCCVGQDTLLSVSLSVEVYKIVPAVMDNHLLRLFFTGDRVVVRVAIRGTELYDLVKINAMELQKMEEQS